MKCRKEATCAFFAQVEFSTHSAKKSPMSFARTIAKVIGLFSLPRKYKDFYGGSFRSEVVMLLYNDRYSILNTEEWNMFL